MNERIQQLVEQAFIITTDGKIGHVNTIMVEKFTELIVKECVAVADDYVKDCTCEEHINCKHPRSAIGRKIREYFGVEE